jgi:hypothetical protein
MRLKKENEFFNQIHFDENGMLVSFAECLIVKIHGSK